ncbi:hypothetical protein [Yoonia sp. 208BN28-4]|uniref:hypothetical protein n=1 Tax=Yoonia sp. 208BN28-4 TaxID=3126505 RepID=UPI00309B1D3B
MKQISFSVLALVATTATAQAACFADYKAKQDDPLRLHYGVAEIRGDCTVSNAQAQLSGRLDRDGWELLNVLGIFDDAGLAERRTAAGEYYLRY